MLNPADVFEVRSYAIADKQNKCFIFTVLIVVGCWSQLLSMYLIDGRGLLPVLKQIGTNLGPYRADLTLYFSALMLVKVVTSKTVVLDTDSHYRYTDPMIPSSVG